MYQHVHVSEVPDSPVVECTIAAGLEVARAALSGTPKEPPATAAEREALRAASGVPDTQGASVPDLLRGLRARYGLVLSAAGLPADLPALPDGTFLVVQGNYHDLPAHYQRWDAHFASQDPAGHAVCVFRLGGGLMWCDPLAPWGPYAGEPVAPAVVAAYFGGLPGAQTTRARLPAAPPAPPPPAAIGPRPAGATGWIEVTGSFFRWIDATHRQTYSARRFSAWAQPETLPYQGRRYPGHRVMSGGYGGWLVFAGPGIAYHAA